MSDWQDNTTDDEIPGCVECGGLLCVQIRDVHGPEVPGPRVKTSEICVAMSPQPPRDVVRTRCASCGTTLYDRTKHDR